MKQVLLLSVLGAIISLSVACGGSTSSSAPSPAPIDVTGSWSGQIAFNGQPTQMVWTLTQGAGGTVTGSMRDALSSGTVLINGAFTGTVAGTTLTYAIAVGPGSIPSLPTCTGQLTGSMQIAIGVPSTMIGSFNVASSSCASPLTGGALTLTR